LANVASTTSTTNTSKQTTQYNKYCIWILKLGIQIKFSMTLLEIYWPWIVSESWYYVRRLISLHHIVLFDVNFQSHSTQMPFNAFAYPIRMFKSQVQGHHRILAWPTCWEGWPPHPMQSCQKVERCG
jgi:hypothetical protein